MRGAIRANLLDNAAQMVAAADLPRRRRIVDALLGIRDELSVPLIYVTYLPEDALSVAIGQC